MSRPSNDQNQTAAAILRLFVGASATGLYATFANWAYTAAVSSDMQTAVIALFFAWMMGVSGLALSEVMGAFPTADRRKLNLIFGTALAIITVGLGFYFQSRRPTIPAKRLR